ncbi:hypothetical protein EsH8_X_000361 [Colletotrichum jinshuiense]
MKLSSIVVPVLSSHIGLTHAGPVLPSRDPANVPTIFQLANNITWFENLAVRSNGEIIATRMDAPELWLIDPRGRTGRNLVTIPGIRGIQGITEVNPNVFVVTAGNYTVNPVVVSPGSMGVYRVDLTQRKPVVIRAAALPDSIFLNGVARWNDREVLVADTEASAVYRVNVATGATATVLSGPDFATVNGLAVQGRNLYYTSTGNQTFFRVQLQQDATAAGPVQPIFSGRPMDDFALAEDGTAYISTMEQNLVIEVSPQGREKTIAGATDSLAVAASSSVRFAPDRKSLYVTTSGGTLAPIFGTLMEPAKIVQVRLG